MSNKIERISGRVRKTYESRINYVRETAIYDRIKDCNLAPRVTSVWDGAIEREFVAGKSFDEVLRATMTSPLDFMKNIDMFFLWYKRFRDKLNLSIGDSKLDDFIVHDDNLYIVDLEHIKPGSIERDVAYMTAHICFIENGYTRFGLEDAKVFVKRAWNTFTMSSAKLYPEIKVALEDYCEKHDIVPIKNVNEYIASFVCCSFVHRPKKKKKAIRQIKESVKKSDQVWTMFAEDITGDAEKAIRYLLSTEKEMYDIVFLTVGGSIIEYPMLIRTEGAMKKLDNAIGMKLNLKEAMVMNFSYKGLPVENMK